MGHSLQIRFLAVILAVACAPTTLAQQDDPRLQGRTIEHWISMIEQGDAAGRERALVVFGKLSVGGEIAVPRLRALVRRGTRDVRIPALAALGRLGRGAERAVPLILETTAHTDAETRATAFAALAAIIAASMNPHHLEGEERFLETFLNGLSDVDPRVRAEAVGAITADSWIARRDAAELAQAIAAAYARKDSAPIQPGLTRAMAEIESCNVILLPAVRRSLRHADPEVRADAARAAQSLGTQAAPAVPELLAGLEDEDPVARQAVLALGAIGPAAASAVGKLRALLPSREFPDRALEIIAALEAIGPGAKAALPEIEVRLALDPSAVVRAVLAIDREGATAARVVATALRHFRPQLRADDLEDLHRMGIACRAASAELYGSLAWSPVPVARALRAAGEPAAKIVAALGAALEEPDANPLLADAMLAADPRGTHCIPHLVARSAREPCEGTERHAALMLGCLGPRLAQETVAPLTESLQRATRNADLEAQRVALRALGAVGASAHEAIPAVIEAWAGREDPGNDNMFARALVRMDPDGEVRPAQETLARMVEELDSETRYYVVEEMAGLRRIDRDILGPPLLRLVQTSEDDRSSALLAARMLGHEGVATPEVREAITALLQVDWDQGVAEVSRALDGVLAKVPETRAELLQRLESPDDSVPSLYAIYALTRVAYAGDATVIAALDRLASYDEEVIRRVATQMRKRLVPAPEAAAATALALEVDPEVVGQGTWWIRGAPEPIPRPTPRADPLGEGRFRVSLSTGVGFSGYELELFLGRGSDGTPSIRGAMIYWTCIHPEDPTIDIGGRVVLASGDWGRVERIRGRFELDGHYREQPGHIEEEPARIVGGFDIPNPFRR